MMLWGDDLARLMAEKLLNDEIDLRSCWLEVEGIRGFCCLPMSVLMVGFLIHGEQS
jgi:hypothetical protein